MPIYKDKLCEGACERFALPCLRPEHYVKVAEKYNAEPAEPSGNLIVDGRPVRWSYFTLNIQGDDLEQALDDLVAEDKKRFPRHDFGDDEVRLWAQAWVKEVPCYLGCEIIICGHCGTQHERDLVYDGTCEIKRSLDRKEEETHE